MGAVGKGTEMSPKEPPSGEKLRLLRTALVFECRSRGRVKPMFGVYSTASLTTALLSQR